MGTETIIAISVAVLSVITCMVGYFVRNQDKVLDTHDALIAACGKNHSALELKMAENYATKTTVLALFEETNRNNKEAIARVEKNIETANVSVVNLTQKVDGIKDSINSFQIAVMNELSKKT